MKYIIVVTPSSQAIIPWHQKAFCEDVALAIQQIFGQNVETVEVIEKPEA